MDDTSQFPGNKNQYYDSLTVDEVSVINMNVDGEENTPRDTYIRSGKGFSKESEEGFCQNYSYQIPRQENNSTGSALSSTFDSEIFNRSRMKCDASVQTNFTLSSRESFEPNDLLKSYCVEIFDEKSIILPSSCNSSSIHDRTPPSRCFKPGRPLFKKETPGQSALVRKLSLRSKTMICSALGKSRNKPRVFQRHKSMEEKVFISNTYSLMPHKEHSPLNSGRILVNPFEVDLTDTIVSPDVFANVLSPSEDSEFLRWTIEDISSINPVPIDEDVKLPSDDENPERESLAQQEIDRYFSETHLVLSPYDFPKSCESIAPKDAKHNSVINAAASTPKRCDSKLAVDVLNNSTQTVLTLPTHLSDDLEESVHNYFKNYEAEDMSLNASNLRRKLFFHSEDDPPSPVRFEKSSSPLMNSSWKFESSPLAVHGRHLTPMMHHQHLSSPEVSPVFRSPAVKLKNGSLTCKKTLHLYFPADDSAPTEDRVPRRAESAEFSSEIGSLPTSQDTGYQTEDSSQQITSPTAFTPTRSRVSVSHCD